MRTNNSILIRRGGFIINYSTLLLFLSLIIASSCDTTNPPSNSKITLELEDASCTEAWLSLKTENISLPTEITIKQNDSTFLSTNINTNDTILFIDNLLPNRTYSFNTTIKQLNNETIKSSNLNVTTMDTTSHNFTWETFTFGGGSSSYFNDVAIINENNIWAVGKIHTEDTDKFDSNGVWVQPYNAVHWDGNAWELKRIGGYGYGEYSVVYAFAENNVWFNGTIQWDGIRYLAHTNNFPLLPNGDGWRINSMWGTSSQDFYVVGSDGHIAHYNGSSWTKIESGTVGSIVDICGLAETNIKYCISVAGDNAKNSILTKIDGNNKVTNEDLLTDRRFGGIWTKNGFPIYLSGDGTFTNKSKTWKDDFPSNTFVTSDIFGKDLNDIITCGAFGLLAHNNGASWKKYPIMIENSYTSVKMNQNIVVATGFSGGKAAIVVGRR